MRPGLVWHTVEIDSETEFVRVVAKIRIDRTSKATAKPSHAIGVLIVAIPRACRCPSGRLNEWLHVSCDSVTPRVRRTCAVSCSMPCRYVYDSRYIIIPVG